MTSRFFLHSACLSLMTAALLCAAAVPGALARPPPHAGTQGPPPHATDAKPLMIKEQGSFAFGGTVITGDDGNTFHGDHGYAQYQIPPNARKLPLVMWHGGGQFSKTWETTPDGRDGYQNIFVRRGFATYIIDQPRRGRAGKTTEGTTIPDGVPNEANLFTVFRLGTWVPPAPPTFFPGVQFSRKPEALNQYFRQITPDTGPDTLLQVAPDAVATLFDQVGPAVLLSHSMSGLPGWLTAIQSKNVRAIVSYEPVRFVFPDVVPPTAGFFPSVAVPLADFLKLTKIPIQIVFGDFINQCCPPGTSIGEHFWVNAVADAQLFVDAVNAHGGKAEILHLPDVGVTGNTHFPMSDLNNLEVADNLSAFLQENGLDKRK